MELQLALTGCGLSEGAQWSTKCWENCKAIPQPLWKEQLLLVKKLLRVAHRKAGGSQVLLPPPARLLAASTLMGSAEVREPAPAPQSRIPKDRFGVRRQQLNHQHRLQILLLYFHLRLLTLKLITAIYCNGFYL